MVALIHWSAVGLLACVALGTATVARTNRLKFRRGAEALAEADVSAPGVVSTAAASNGAVGRSTSARGRILFVGDDDDARTRVRSMLELDDYVVDEADDTAAASVRLAARRPDLVVVDAAMPRTVRIAFTRELKSDPRTRDIAVVVLLAEGATIEEPDRHAGADAFLRQPFDRGALRDLVEELSAADEAGYRDLQSVDPHEPQLPLDAEDIRRVLQIEHAQRKLFQNAYRETVVALAHAIDSKDARKGGHYDLVRLYALELAAAVDPSLLDEPGLEYGFILHDIGKVAIPDHVLTKAEPLTAAERTVLETHPLLGEQIVGHAALLRGHGARVVRSHHERWDGAGYPDGLVADNIPLAARIFAVADALDAMTTTRPFRRAASWPDAIAEIRREAGAQFDPDIVAALGDREEQLRMIYYEVSSN